MKIKELSAGEITDIAIKELTWRGVVCWRQNNISVKGRSFRGKTGLSDIVGYGKHTGLITLCEVKKIGDTMKPAQKDLLRGVHKAGGIALVAFQDEETGQVKVESFNSSIYND